MPIITLNSVDYRQFRLDINEVQSPGSADEFLSVDQIQLFTTTNMTTATQLGAAAPFYGASPPFGGDPGEMEPMFRAVFATYLRKHPAH